MTDNKAHLLSNKEKSFLKLEIFAEFSEITRLTLSLRDFFCKHNFSLSHANEICLVIEELAINTIMHGYKNMPLRDREKICVQVGCDDEWKKVCILFKDAGVLFDPTLIQPLRKEDTIGGWGLMFVKKTMHNFKYERDGKHNILKLSKRYV